MAKPSARKKLDVFAISAARTAVLITAEDNGGEKLPTFAMAAYTGAVMHLSGFWDPVIVDLENVQVPSQNRPILRQHDEAKIVGHSTRIDVSDKGIHVEGTISGVGPDAAEVVALAKNGFQWQASIGATAVRTEFVEPGQTATVNGREINGPVIISRETILGEISFVPLGADGATSARVAASQAQGRSAMKPKIKARVKAEYETFDEFVEAMRGMKAEEVDEKDREMLQEIYDKLPEAKAEEPKEEDEPPVEGGAKVDLKAQRMVLAAEKRRVSGINLVASSYTNHIVKLDGKDVDIVAHAIENGLQPADVELHLLKSNAAKPPVHVLVPQGIPGVAPAKVLEAAIIQSSRMTADLKAQVEKQYGDQVMQAAHSAFKGRIGLQQLLIEAARANGYHGYNFRGDHREIMQAAFSTKDVSGILSNVANKFLLQGYMSVEQAWKKISAIRAANDFKTMTSYRLTGANGYQKIAPDGQIPHATLGEQPFTNKVDTYATMVAITRQDQINDDLGALTEIPQKLGADGGRKLNSVFWAEFLDDAAFFNTDNSKGNYYAHANAVLGLTGLGVVEGMFRNQTDPDDNPLGIEPKILLVASGNGPLARSLWASTNIQSGATTGQPEANPYAGLYEPVVSSYLKAAPLVWYLLADPAVEPVMETAFLNGVESPIVETAETDFNTLGIQMRGYHDFGCAKQSFRGGVKSKGAA